VSVIRSTIGPTGPGVKAVAGRVVVGPVWRVWSPLGLQPRHPGRELEQQCAELPFRQPGQEQPEQPQQQHRPASREHDPRSVAGRLRTSGAYAGCPGIHPAPAAFCAHGRPAGCIGFLPGKEQGAPGFVAMPMAWRASRRFRIQGPCKSGDFPWVRFPPDSSQSLPVSREWRETPTRCSPLSRPGRQHALH